jgi:hypothetical protein
MSRRHPERKVGRPINWERIAAEALVVGYLENDCSGLDPFGGEPWPGWARDLADRLRARKRKEARIDAMSHAQRNRRLATQRKAVEHNEKRARGLHEVRRYVDGIGPRPAALDAPPGVYERLKRYEREYRVQKDQVDIEWFRDHGNT